MSESMSVALKLLVQGMVGIFVVLGVIALLVMLMQRIDRRAEKKREHLEDQQL